MSDRTPIGASTLDARLAAEPKRRSNKARRLRQQAVDAGQQRLGIKPGRRP